MKRFYVLLALLSILFSIQVSAQVDIDSRPTDGAADVYYGGLGLGPTGEGSGKPTWTAGDVPFCYETVGANAGEFRPIGSGTTRYMTFDGVYLKMGDTYPFCWGTGVNVCSAYSTANSRLEFSSPGSGNPVYSEDGFSTGPSANPHIDFDISTDVGGIDDQIYTGCTAANDCYIDFKVDPGSDTEATRLRVDKNGITVTGAVSGGVSVQTKSTDYVILDAEAYNSRFINTGASTRSFTLPSAVAGMTLCALNGQGVAQILRLYPASGDYIVYDGTRTTITTGYIGATASAANQVCVFAADATDWYVQYRAGTWTRY